MRGEITGARCFLLKNIHVPQLNIDVRGNLVTNARKKSVLVKSIVHDILSEVQKDFVNHSNEWSFRFYLFTL